VWSDPNFSECGRVPVAGSCEHGGLMNVRCEISTAISKKITVF
jgi:hypothetical protein